VGFKKLLPVSKNEEEDEDPKELGRTRGENVLETLGIEGDEDFNVLDLIKSAYDKDTQSIRDLKIDDRDLPRAKNFFHFCTDFLGKGARVPFARMMWVGYHLMGEYCPKCSDPKWEILENVPVDFRTKNFPEHIQFLEYGKCPKCKASRAKLYSQKKLKFYYELDACLGQRASKSTFSSVLSTYLLHAYLKSPRLSSIAEGIQEATPLTGTFVGVRLSDAFSLLWTPVVETIKQSPWFQDYHKLLLYYSKKYGTELLKQHQLFLRYANKNIEMYPSGPTKRGLRGRTRFLAVIDEIGWFPTSQNKSNIVTGELEQERANSDEVYVALDRSLSTVRSELTDLTFNQGYRSLPLSLLICISSPSSKKDKIMRLIEENKNSDTGLTIHLPTWEINPRIRRDNPIIVKAFHDDPLKAERDFGANPPMTESAFIEDTGVEKCFNLPNRVSYQYLHKVINEKKYRSAKFTRISPPNQVPASVMAIDAGYSNNSFSMIIGHRDNLQIIADVLVEIIPGHGNVLHYNALYNMLMKPLIKEFNVRFMYADRWQSISILHRAQEEFGVEIGMYSVKMPDFNLTKSKLMDGEFNLPKIEDPKPTEEEMLKMYPHCFKAKPAAHLLFQMMTVQEAGKTVTKGADYTDDIFRALVLLTSRLFDEKVYEQIKKLGARKRGNSILGVVVSRGEIGGISPSLTSKVAVIAPRL